MRTTKNVISSNIASLTHDDESDELEVVFQNGGIYRYYGVEKDVYFELINSDLSIGSAFHRLIRNAGYDYDKLN